MDTLPNRVKKKGCSQHYQGLNYEKETLWAMELNPFAPALFVDINNKSIAVSKTRLQAIQ